MGTMTSPLLRACGVAVALGCGASHAAAQQVADNAFAPPIAHPAFAAATGPVVAIDEAHHNFHTATGRYQPFAELLRRDGFRVGASASAFTAEALRDVRILVIANALHERNREDWTLPTPSAFTTGEIGVVRAWVAGGGSLLLIADHMPMAGAAQALGAAFGITWHNGFATAPGASGPFIFRRDGQQQLALHAITDGRTSGERVTAIATFTGSAFQAGEGWTPLLTLAPHIVSLAPQEAWAFTPDTPRQPVGGWLQGAVLALGQGRVAVFGEAAMFTAQLGGPQRQPMGMNAPGAEENPQFLLHVMRWLARVI